MKKLLVLAVVTAVGVVGVQKLRGTETKKTDSELAFGRIWIDHMPRSERDMINVFLAIEDDPVGVFQKTSVWSGAYEMFKYEANGDEVRIVYPQTGQRDKVKVSATECEEGDWNYCL